MGQPGNKHSLDGHLSISISDDVVNEIVLPLDISPKCGAGLLMMHSCLAHMVGSSLLESLPRAWNAVGPAPRKYGQKAIPR